MLQNPILYISTASDGHMGIRSPQNRARFFKKIKVTEDQIVNVVVSHGTKIKQVDRKDGGEVFDRYDGLMTNEKGLYLGLLVGDCIPVAIYDPGNEVIAIIHCGWRGLSRGIIKKCLARMKKTYQTDAAKVVVYLGAHICQRHYEVGSEIVQKFAKYSDSIEKIGKRNFLDLGKVAIKQLADIGVQEKNIKVDETCTFEDNKFFSFRRNNTKNRNLYLLSLGS